MKLIDVDALKEKIYKDFDRCHSVYEFTACILLRIEAAPKIEPERKQGHIITDNCIDYCSECGKSLGIGYMNYCGYCGVKLDGGTEDDQT